MTPKQTCKVFFADRVSAGHSIDDFEGKPVEIDLTGKTEATIKYNKKGDWEIVKIIDRTKAEGGEARDVKPEDGNREHFMGPRGR